MLKINNQNILNYDFLSDMYNADYFPNFLVDKVKRILLGVCEQIEQQHPDSNNALFVITHAAVKEINKIKKEFEANESEIETGARENILVDFEFIVKTYGFNGIDIEDVIAPREW